MDVFLVAVHDPIMQLLPTPKETVVVIEGLHVQCYVGVPDVERASSQDIVMDLRLTLADPMIPEDTMSASVSYKTVVDAVRELTGQKRWRLLEKMAEDVATVCFQDTRVYTVNILIRKVHRLPECAAVGVQRTFERGE